jgi:hypothetical protein
MTIDERLEALTQTVELIAAMQRDNEQRWEARWAQIRQALQEDGEHIRALTRIAEIHERRLTHLEGGEQ